MGKTVEETRLDESRDRTKNWKRWGPYLSERQWATVREDYSADGSSWNFFPHEQARSRAYRWGEDGLMGITDRECRLCFAIALWNGHDRILKERLFGLTSEEGNHGEDVKECYYYLDSTPTHSYMKGLYKYPLSEFPYKRLLDENKRRSLKDPEFELEDTGIFEKNHYVDLFVEYAKENPNDILIRVTVVNRSKEAAQLHLLPTLWFRDTWTWGCAHEGCSVKPSIRSKEPGLVETLHETLGPFKFAYEQDLNPTPLFTDNQTNFKRLYGVENNVPYVKDAFHDYVIHKKEGRVNPNKIGTKFSPYTHFSLKPGESQELRFRLFASDEAPSEIFGDSFNQTFEKRKKEADLFYDNKIGTTLSADEKAICRQAYAGLLWSKQFYHYVVEDWMKGDKVPPPSERQKAIRNRDWPHLFARDILSMPDKWEYPWFAAWDLAFHMISFAKIDPDFAKMQMTLLLREWYMHPNGQIPAYEYCFSDVNPPVHAWACWRIYKMTGRRGARDRGFLESSFQKLLINFTWWVNRKDIEGNNLFSGGFLGLDNIGVFNRSMELPSGGALRQADGTAWMAFYCLTMLSIALELAFENRVYEDLASKFFEHFIRITDAINVFGGTGLWDEQDGFYYDQLKINQHNIPLRTRSLVGLIPLIAVEVLEEFHLEKLKGFSKRLNWFLQHRGELENVSTFCKLRVEKGHRILAIPSKERLIRILAYLLDETEFLSPYGIRSVSKHHEQNPYIFNIGNEVFKVDYEPGEGTSRLFGGNSNWRGPIWMPINFLIIEALERYDHYYGDSLKVEYPKQSGKMISLKAVAEEISKRLIKLFKADASGKRPCMGENPYYSNDPHWSELLLFHEYFHADTGKGLGASHQTGWTSLITKLLDK